MVVGGIVRAVLRREADLCLNRSSFGDLLQVPQLEGRHLVEDPRFARYADDLLIVVRSVRAGDRVKASITRYLTSRLKLKVNE